jgi:hypothetical protein
MCARANRNSCDNKEGITTFAPKVVVCETEGNVEQSAAEVWSERMANQESSVRTLNWFTWLVLMDFQD